MLLILAYAAFINAVSGNFESLLVWFIFAMVAGLIAYFAFGSMARK
jgi:uncharacterized membrane protein YedE/YeeE